MQSIQVPLIARTQYSTTGQTNLLDFSDFFKRALNEETAKTRAAESDGQESTSFSPSHSLASAIQTWLFFGIASEALGRNIRYEKFAGADPDGPHLFIDLRILEWYWRELKARWDELDDSLTAAEFEAKRAQPKNIYESEMPVLVYFRNVGCHAVSAASVFEAGTDKYVCDSNVHEDHSFVLPSR